MNEKDRANAITNSPSISEDRGLSFFQPGATVEVLKRLMPLPGPSAFPFFSVPTNFVVTDGISKNVRYLSRGERRRREGGKKVLASLPFNHAAFGR